MAEFWKRFEQLSKALGALVKQKSWVEVWPGVALLTFSVKISSVKGRKLKETTSDAWTAEAAANASAGDRIRWLPTY